MSSIRLIRLWRIINKFYSNWIALRILACLAVMTCGCNITVPSEPVSRDDLIGEYEGMWHGGLRDRLRLNADGTYVREFTSFRGEVFIDHGTWRLQYFAPDSNPRYVSLVLPDFLDRFDMDSLASDERLSGAAGLPDSVPAFRMIGVFKHTPGATTWMLLGGRDNPAWQRAIKP